MAKSIPPFTFKNGFREPGTGAPWETKITEGDKEESHYVTPPTIDALTSTVYNDFGMNTLRTWPTLFNGTSSPHGLPDWWKPGKEVDVLICGGRCCVRAFGIETPKLTVSSWS